MASIFSRDRQFKKIDKKTKIPNIILPKNVSSGERTLTAAELQRIKPKFTGVPFPKGGPHPYNPMLDKARGDYHKKEGMGKIIGAKEDRAPKPERMRDPAQRELMMGEIERYDRSMRNSKMRDLLEKIKRAKRR